MVQENREVNDMRVQIAQIDCAIDALRDLSNIFEEQLEVRAEAIPTTVTRMEADNFIVTQNSPKDMIEITDKKGRYIGAIGFSIHLHTDMGIFKRVPMPHTNHHVFDLVSESD